MSKRASAYKHGQPGREFEEERPEDPMDEPKRATAAQMAARKIKGMKGPRRPAGVSSGLSAFNSNPPTANAFNFGPDPHASNPFAQSAPAPQSSSGGFTFGQPQQQDASSGGAFSFGNNSTSSFPPAQSASNAFANSTTASFPPASSGFGNNNNTNGSMSPFSAKPDLNFGNTSTSFGASTPAGSSFTFGAQQSQPPAFGASQNNTSNASASNPFTFGATPNKESSTPASNLFGNTDNKVSTSASSGGLFNAAPTPQTNTFAGFGQNNNAASASAPASNLFGNLNNSSAASTTPFQFGASTTGTAAQESESTPKALFGTISAAAQASSASETPKPLFSSINNASSEAPVTTGGSSLFGASMPATFTFGAPAGGADSSSVSKKAETAETPAPATPAPATPAFKFGNTTPAAETPAPAIQAPATPAFKFGNSTPAASNNLFAGFGATTSQPSTSTPAPVSFGGFGQTSQGGLFSQTPKAAPTATPISKSFQAAPSTVPAKKTALFGVDHDTAPASTEPSKNEQATTESAAPSTNTSAQIEKPAQNLFAAFSQPATQAPSNGLSQSPKPAASTPRPPPYSFTHVPTFEPAPKRASGFTPQPASTTTTSTAQEPSKETSAPPVPRVTVPPNWAANTTDSTNVLELVQELTALNEAYRAKLAQLPATADWSSLSKFHSQKSTELKKKIDDLKKKAAAAKGVTGEETVLSTKRKNDEFAQSESSFKKARSGEPPSTPNSKISALPSTTPKTAPPGKSFNLFSASTGPQETTPAVNLFASTSTQPTVSAAPKPASSTAEQKDTESAGAGGFKPNLASSTTSTSTGFKPNLGSSTSASTGFQPNFGASSAAGKSSSGGFFGQFGGKTKEELRKERLKKAINEEWDSDEDDDDFIPKSEFIARWNRKEDERQAELDAAANSANVNFKFDPTAATKKDTPAFTFTPASSNVPSVSQSAASGASTPGFLNSRVGSPAPSTDGARSVFDTPFDAQTPSDNPFSHLSAASSQREDDSDDENSAKSSVDETKKRKLVETEDAESESSETLEESMRRKKPAIKAGSLADRMTRDNSEAAPDAAEKDDSRSMFSGTNAKHFNLNGSQTPAPKKSFQFDFDGAAAKSAPPKQNAFAPKMDAFAGDQTFKIGTPIKFGASTGGSTPFSFTPAAATTPTPAESSATLAKPAGNPFAFLSTATSAATSAVSSRAATPATDAEGTDPAAINEDEAQNFVDTEDKSTLSEAERSEFDVLFEHPEAIVTKLVKKEGVAPKWQNFANGRLFVLKSREDQSVIMRLRMKTGAVKINNRFVPSIKSTVAGKNKSQVRTVAPLVKPDGTTGFEDLIVAFKAGTVPEKQALAEKFSTVYNDNI